MGLTLHFNICPPLTAEALSSTFRLHSSTSLNFTELNFFSVFLTETRRSTCNSLLSNKVCINDNYHYILQILNVNICIHFNTTNANHHGQQFVIKNLVLL